MKESFFFVIPAKAGIQSCGREAYRSRLRLARNQTYLDEDFSHY
jgi:hypothetical protein